MKLFAVLPGFLFFLAFSSAGRAADLTFQSGPKQTALLELYTSEGCSSCPPAEAWLSRLKSDTGLWKTFVPVAFHVDYWNNLGWRDRYSSKQFTDRQRDYSLKWGSGSVYTPEFVLNGAEWKDWAGSTVASSNDRPAGELSATISDGQRVAIRYTPPSNAENGNWQAHIALLGSGISSRVRAGENSGRQLEHDFVVLNDRTVPLRSDGGAARAEVSLDDVKTEGVPRKAIAVWVIQAGKMAPMQATGGWLTAK